MTQQSLISIIIPVYKVERLLRRCLDSVLAQTYSNWEAICVDDGSPDTCPQILDEYAAMDKRFKVIHTTNGGLSAARNTALEHAEGEYIIFLDSDDFLHPQTLELSEAFARRDGSDMVAYTYNRAYRTSLISFRKLFNPESHKRHFPKYTFDKIKSVTTDDIYSYVTEISYEKLPGVAKRFRVKHCQVWRCCYRSSAIKHIRFVEGINFEDLPWWGEVLLNTRRATIINLPLYYYYPNFDGYIFSSGDANKTVNLKKAIAAAEAVYADKGTDYQRQKWEQHFLVPFRNMLVKKVKRKASKKR